MCIRDRHGTGHTPVIYEIDRVAGRGLFMSDFRSYLYPEQVRRIPDWLTREDAQKSILYPAYSLPRLHLNK